jgi:FtsH-binding integral membrane protein
MLDTLLAKFPNARLIVVGDNNYHFNGADPQVVTLYERPSDIKWAHKIREAAVHEGTTKVVVTRLPKSSQGGLYALPFGLVACADVVVEMATDGSYTVLKNRFGASGEVVTTPAPVLPDLIPESAMTNDDINASSASLPIAPTPKQTARFMARVYAWMGAGVITSAATAYLVASHPDTHAALTSGATGVCVILAPFALIGVLGYTSYKGRPYLAAAAFTLLTALLGVTMSSIAVKATGDAAFAGDVVTSLLIASGMFGGLATLGYTTKRDLSGMGTFLFASLWGLILALIANVFIGSTGFQFAISAVGVLLFSALIAYDVQRAKYAAVMGDGAAVLCALSLYLDFLNLFQFVLSMLGFSSRED